MDAFTICTGPVAFLPLANLDTDVIIRIERLTTLERKDLGPYAMEALRYRADGSEDPGFVLNTSLFRNAPFLLVGPNFGCGSSREGAVWALHAQGIRCLIGETFGDIFFANCFQNGVLPLQFPRDIVLRIGRLTAKGEPLTIDLIKQKVALPDGQFIAFEIDPRRREALLEGLDDIEQTLKRDPIILAWQQRDRLHRPWAWPQSRLGFIG